MKGNEGKRKGETFCVRALVWRASAAFPSIRSAEHPKRAIGSSFGATYARMRPWQGDSSCASDRGERERVKANEMK